MSEKPKAQLARELGVRVGQLRTWRLEFEKEAVTGIASAGVQLLYELAELAPGGRPLELRASPDSAAAHILSMVDLRRLVLPPPANSLFE